MPEAARRIEVGAITAVLSVGRAEDSFALVTGGGPLIEIPFGSGRDALQKGAEALANSPTGKVKAQGTLDALMEAINWLQPPKVGDAIFVFALDLKGRHHARWSKVRNSAVRRHIRVFSFQLDRTTAHPPDPIDSFTTKQIESRAFATGPGPNPVQLLAEYTGGEVEFENTKHGGRDYKLTEQRLHYLTREAQGMYARVIYYDGLFFHWYGPMW